MEQYQIYIIAAILVAVWGWKQVKLRQQKPLVHQLIQSGAVVLDVRSAAEFQSGFRPGSINIPLADLGRRCHELDKGKPIVLCCASGARSGMAMGILKQNGFQEVVNAGAWQNTLN